MNKAGAAKRVAKLRELIAEYRFEYHVNDRSTMSEAAADSLKRELSELEAQYPQLITEDSPTQRVAGQPLPQFTSVGHKWPMLSLNDAFSETDVSEWLARITKLDPAVAKSGFWVDIKMDGLACSLIYEDGQLVRGVTRGDGTIGEDVTQNIRTIDSIPLRLREHKFAKGRTEVRGEIVMHRDDFKRLNDKRRASQSAEFKNPRNLAAGTIRQLDPALVAARPLHFYGYDLLRDEPGDVPTYKLAYLELNQLGFRRNQQATKLASAGAIMDFAATWEEKRRELPFNTDGLVIKVNDRTLMDKLGVVGKAPRGAVAYKYPAEEATTKVKDIIISIGRTGAATPIAVLEPVNLAGTTVQNASLHNADEIERKDIRVGDTVIIHKAGDIIPQVKQVLLKLRDGSEKKFDMERELKEHPLKFERPEGEAVWRAVNRSEPTIVKRAVQHYASKGALDIEGLGEKNVELLVDSGLVKDLADIYLVTEEDLLKLERFAEISAGKLVEAIAAAKQPKLERFLVGLGIRHVGAQTAIDLAARFKRFEAIEAAGYDELAEIEGVGEVVAHSILGWFADDANQELVKKFKRVGVWPQPAKQVSGPLKGQSFVITGTLNDMSREEATERIRALGGTFQTAVGKSTTYLVAGNNTGQSKLDDAKKYGTKVIDEGGLKELINDNKQ